MRFAVTGGRNFTDIQLVRFALMQMPADATLVHGDARGADRTCAEFWGDIHGSKNEAHPAQWDACGNDCRPDHRKRREGGTDYCPTAGFRRNQEMVDSDIDVLIVFPGGNGTADMRRRSQKAGVRIFDVSVSREQKASTNESS